MNDNFKIAVTGGIGSGKSTVTALLKEKGYAVFDCDSSAKRALKNRKVIKEIKKCFPYAVKGFLFPKVNKKTLAESVFACEEKRKKLEGITHPVILKEVLSKADNTHKTAFIEVPLLFEGGYAEYFDKTLVILRNKEARIKSVMARSNLSEEQVLERMAAQADYDSLDLSGCAIVRNDGTIEDLKKNVDSALAEILK